MPAHYAHTWPRLGSWDGLSGPLPPVRCPGFGKRKGLGQPDAHAQCWAFIVTDAGVGTPPPHFAGGDTEARGSNRASDPRERLARRGSGPGKQVLFGCLSFLVLFLVKSQCFIFLIFHRSTQLVGP